MYSLGGTDSRRGFFVIGHPMQSALTRHKCNAEAGDPLLGRTIVQSKVASISICAYARTAVASAWSPAAAQQNRGSDGDLLGPLRDQIT
ncbi:hypothetical protein ANO11243_068070 [Dothideomycetidae sp. 11243]|nr:hypothetical protein ANO11243_068070 [fungal sp. No.11243]